MEGPGNEVMNFKPQPPFMEVNGEQPEFSF